MLMRHLLSEDFLLGSDLGSISVLAFLNVFLKPSHLGPELVYSSSTGMYVSGHSSPFKVETRIGKITRRVFSCIKPLMFAYSVNFENIQGQTFWFKPCHYSEIKLTSRRSDI